MSSLTAPPIEWVVLTRGDRPAELRRSVVSLTAGHESRAAVTVVFNGSQADASDEAGVAQVMLPENVGIPAGRDIGARRSHAAVVGFLDDDAEASPGVGDRIVAAFDEDPQLGAVALRLVDEHGQTARRHVPRLGGRNADRGGEVALFLGGACAIRREAYEDAGGYWNDLFYGHEELELTWRLIDRGWRIRYLADATVFHPRTEIARHPDGWRMTGRNRVMIARRTLPWPVAVVHVLVWLAIGLVRAPGRTGRRAYVQGWTAGWRSAVEHRPVRWSTVWRLLRLRRPPFV